MKKEKVEYVCNECGSIYSRWQGQCKECKEWNTIIEIKKEEINPKNKVETALKSISNKKERKWIESDSDGIKYLSDVSIENGEHERFSTGKNEFDRVLGGGIMKGSVILLSGEPGAGKSTLLIEVCEYISKDKNVMYISGEESEIQIKNRATRLSISGKNIAMLSEVEINKIIEQLSIIQPDFIVVDSIQTIHNKNSDYSSCSSASLKENTTIFNRIAKSTGISMILIGHVNKTGNIAGPKELEHIVDVICEIENESDSEYRIIRANKNRFGNIDEVGVFMMTENGMKSVDNPSELFISENRDAVHGTNILATIEGNRPLLIEIQALVSESEFNYPKRLASGVELNRLNMIIAILNNHTGIKLNNQDVYVSAVGGIKISDPAADLPISLSVMSSYFKKAIDSNIACFGELDLTGRLRPIQRSELRIKEAILRGFDKIIIPSRNVPKDKSKFNIEIIGAKNINEVINFIN
jgi:DNA repair protein RadA/Sms